MIFEEHNVGVRNLLERLVLDDLLHTRYHEAVFAVCRGTGVASFYKLGAEKVIQQVVEHILFYGVAVSYIFDYLLRGGCGAPVNR